MNTLICLVVLFGFIYHTYSAEPCQKICRLDNPNCVTRGAFNDYETVVNGVEGLVAPLDPLHIDKLEGVLENVKYKLTNITMTGLKNCIVPKLKKTIPEHRVLDCGCKKLCFHVDCDSKMIAKDSSIRFQEIIVAYESMEADWSRLNVTSDTYDQHLNCPKLVLHFYFEAQRTTKEHVPREYGTVTLTAYNNSILNYGQYSVFVNEDHRPHFFDVTQNSKIELKGKLEVAITNTYLSDTNQVNDTDGCVAGCIWRIFPFLYKLIVTKSMTIFIDEMDVYVRKYPMGEVLPETPHEPSPPSA